MNTLIFLSTTGTINYDPSTLALPGCSAVLVTLHGQAPVGHGFDKIHFVEKMTAESISNIVKSYSQNYSADVRIETANEPCVLIAARVREALDLQGLRPRDVMRFIDKDQMKKAIKDSSLRSPKYLLFDKQRYLSQKKSCLEYCQN